jgi:hypothetical protein
VTFVARRLLLARKRASSPKQPTERGVIVDEL